MREQNGVRVETHQSEPGIVRQSVTFPYTHVDGELRLSVKWSDDDACWVAQYEQPDDTGCIGVGDSQMDALAHLCGALLSQIEALRELTPAPSVATPDARRVVEAARKVASTFACRVLCDCSICGVTR